MKKRALVVFLAGALAASLLAACGSSDTAKGSDASVAENETGSSSETDGEKPKGADATEIVYSNDAIDLAQYKGLAGVKYVYEVTDDDVQEMVDMALSEYVTYKDLDRAAQDGDTLHVSMLGMADGEEAFNMTYSENDAEDNSYRMVLGTAEFGAEVDEKLIGAKAGDKLKFSVSYPDEDEYFPGQTIDYDIEVLAVQEEVLPEYNDEFVKTNLGYNSMEEYEAAQLEELQTEYDEQSINTLYSELLETVVSNSVLKNYDQTKYEEVLANLTESYEYYAEMFGVTYEEILETFGTSEEGLKEDALNQVKQDLVVAAIAEREGINLTEEQFMQSLDELCETYGYASGEEMLGDYSKEELMEYVTSQLVQELIYENAVITEEEGEPGEVADF